MWEFLWILMLVLYVPACIGLIVVVLLQKGKGVGFAGAFGVGPGSDAVFGPRGARTLPQKLTYIMAATFMVLALGMSLISGRLGKGAAPDAVSDKAAVETKVDATVLDDLGSGIKEEKPAAPAAPASSAPAAPAPAPAAPAAPAAEAPAAPAPAAPAAEAPAAPAAPAPEAPAAPAPAAPSGS